MDIDLLLWLQGLRTDALGAVFNAITYLGFEYALIVLTVAIYWCVSKRAATYLFLSLTGSLIVNQCLKLCFCTPRPWMRDPRITPYAPALGDATGYSFPSGHTAFAAACWGALGVLQRKRAWRALCFAIPLLVGFSRCFLGVHTPQDVLVSLIVSVPVLLLAQRLHAALEAKPSLDLPIASSIVAAAALLSAFAALKPYPSDGADIAALTLDVFKVSGGLIGLAVGWVIERRFIRFTTEASVLGHIVRLLGGVALILALRAFLKVPLALLLGERAGNMARYILVVFTAMAGWPALFTRFPRLAKKIS